MKSSLHRNVRMFAFGIALTMMSNVAAQTEVSAGSDAPSDESKSTAPAWLGDTIHGESSLLFQDSADGPYVARVAFPIVNLIQVQSSNRRYQIPNEEIEISADRLELRIPRKFDLPGVLKDAIYLPPKSPNSYSHRKGNPDEWLLYGPGFFHEHQIEITYQHAGGQWSSPMPGYAPELLPKTIAKLQSGSRVAIGVSGDSISTGLDASITGNWEPRQPGYVELVGNELQRMTSSEIAITNRSVAGWSVANGLQDLDHLLESKPDLILIAYGMNDVGRRDPDWFGGQIDQMLEKIQNADAAIEVILVASMVGNAEWVHTPREMFEPYRDELRKRVRPGIALADVTSIWLELLQHKHDLDLTGNGLNHPNDFGHRLYAQALLSLLR